MEDHKSCPADQERNPSSLAPRDCGAKNRRPFLTPRQAGALRGPRSDRCTFPGVRGCRLPVLAGGKVATHLRLRRTQLLAWRQPYTLRLPTARRDGYRGLRLSQQLPGRQVLHSRRSAGPQRLESEVPLPRSSATNPLAERPHLLLNCFGLINTFK